MRRVRNFERIDNRDLNASQTFEIQTLREKMRIRKRVVEISRSDKTCRGQRNVEKQSYEFRAQMKRILFSRETQMSH